MVEKVFVGKALIIKFLSQGPALDEYVKNNAKFGGKVKILRQEKRQGLMRSRMAGIRAAKAEVLVFLDSHIEAGIGWLEPLLFRIQDDPKVRDMLN